MKKKISTMFTPESTLQQIALQDHTLGFFLTRYVKENGWKQSLSACCEKNGLDLDLLSEVLLALSSPKESSADYFDVFSTDQLVKLLEDGHHYYLNEGHTNLMSLVFDLERSGEYSENMTMVWKQFIQVYFLHLKEHFKEEEYKLFPIAQSIADPALPIPLEDIGMIRDYIAEFEAHHMEEIPELSALRSQLLEMPERNGMNALDRIFRYLSFLEKDLFVHDMIEEQVLIPRMKLQLQQAESRWN